MSLPSCLSSKPRRLAGTSCERMQSERELVPRKRFVTWHMSQVSTKLSLSHTNFTQLRTGKRFVTWHMSQVSTQRSRFLIPTLLNYLHRDRSVYSWRLCVQPWRRRGGPRGPTTCSQTGAHLLCDLCWHVSKGGGYMHVMRRRIHACVGWALSPPVDRPEVLHLYMYVYVCVCVCMCVCVCVCLVG